MTEMFLKQIFKISIFDFTDIERQGSSYPNIIWQSIVILIQLFAIAIYNNSTNS